MPSVDLVIKTPSMTETPLHLSIPLEGTVRDIKAALTAAHPEHPDIAEQRLIFAGRLLQDSAQTRDVLRQQDISEPQTFHLMLRGGASRTPSSSSVAATPLPPTRAATAPTASIADAVAPTAPPRTPLHAAETPPHAAAQQQPPAPSSSSAAPSWAQRPSPPPPPPLMPNHSHAFLVGGVPHQFVVHEWGGQPFVFALPAQSAFSAPPPFVVGSSAASVHEHAPSFAVPHPSILPHGPASYYTASAAAAAAAAAAQPPDAAAVEAAHGGAGAGVAAAAAAADGGAAGAARGAAAADAGLGGAADVLEEEGRPDALRLLLKLAFFVYILGQDGGDGRIAWLCVGAAIIFLAQTGRLDFLQGYTLAMPGFRRAPPPPRPRAAADGGAADGHGGIAGDGGAGEAAADDDAAAELVEEGAVLSFYRDVESVLGAFFASLLPSWTPPTLGAAADEAPPQQQAMAAGPGANF
jgi:hypothetical protein